MEQRNFSAIKIMKLVCVILIIGMYTEMFSSLSGAMDFVFVQLLSKIAFPFFFIYASFFFFREIDFSISLSHYENKKVLKTFIIKVLKLYIIWTILYLPLIITNWVIDGFNIMNILLFIRDLVFVGSYAHLWIFLALLFAIIIVYYSSQKIKSSEILVIAFICYMLGMLMNVYGEFLLDLPIISSILNLYYQYFTTAVNGLFYAFIFVFIGMKLSQKRIPLKTTNIFIRVIIFGVIYILEVSLLSWLGYANIEAMMYLSLIPFMYFLFLLLMQYDNDHFNQTINSFSTLLYLLQFYAIAICKQFTFIHQYYIICIIVVLLISGGISYGILQYTKKHRKLKVLYT